MIAASPTSLSLLVQTPGAGDSPSAKAKATFDAKAQARADQKLADLRDAVTKLKSTAASAKASPSDLAKAKLAALKERLKMLMMMGGDPKTVAREAAQIAKEIGEAAKSYADSAGGSDSGAAAEASSAAAAAQQDAASAQGAAQGAAAPDANASDSAGQNSADASQTDASNADPSKTDGAPTDPARTKPQEQTPSVGQTASHGASAGKSRQPDPVIEEARVLEASAKAIAKAALAKLKAQHRDNPDEKAEQANLDQGEKDFNAAAKEVYGDTGAPGGGDLSSSYASDGAAATPSANTSLVSVRA